MSQCGAPAMSWGRLLSMCPMRSESRLKMTLGRALNQTLSLVTPEKIVSTFPCPLPRTLLSGLHEATLTDWEPWGGLWDFQEHPGRTASYQEREAPYSDLENERPLLTSGVEISSEH